VERKNTLNSCFVQVNYLPVGECTCCFLYGNYIFFNKFCLTKKAERVYVMVR